MRTESPGRPLRLSHSSWTLSDTAHSPPVAFIPKVRSGHVPSQEQDQESGLILRRLRARVSFSYGECSRRTAYRTASKGCWKPQSWVGAKKLATIVSCVVYRQYTKNWVTTDEKNKWQRARKTYSLRKDRWRIKTKQYTPRKHRSRIKKTNKTKNDVSTAVVISCRYNYI